MDFLFRYKKIFLSFGFIAIVIALGFIIYTLFFKPLTPEPETKEKIEQKATTTAGLPSAQIGQGQIIDSDKSKTLPAGDQPPTPSQITAPTAKQESELYQPIEITKAPTIGTSLSSDGSAIQYYNTEDGRFYRLNDKGEVVPLSQKVFHSVKKITWSWDKNKAILEYPDEAKIIYDFNTQKQITIPKHWQDFDFEPQGNRFVLKSIGLHPDNRWLAIATDDGSSITPIEPLGEKNATVYPSWSPNKQIIAMFTEGIDFDRQEVFFIGLNKENFKSTVIEGRGFQPLWSPDGQRLVYSVYSSANDFKPMLWIVDAQGERIGANRKSLGLETWANKCVFASSRDLYCAVPENLEEGAGLMPVLAKNTKDNLYKIDIITGAKKLIAVPDGSYNISSLIISLDQNYIYFTDEATGRLHKIKL